MRWKDTLLALLVGWGLPGCLLVSEKINRAPSVVIGEPTMSITRIQPVILSATVHDDQDRAEDLLVSWVVVAASNGGCDQVTHENFSSDKTVVLSSFKTFSYQPVSLAPMCVCAQVSDHQGAKAHGCRLLKALNQPPEAVLKDSLGIASGIARPLYSHLKLTAAESKDPEGDPLQYEWKLTYSGADPGVSATFTPCLGSAPPQAVVVPGKERCFDAKAPGIYQVQLRVADSVTDGGAPMTTWSDWTTFSVPVNPDTPPCIQRTSPETRAQRILLSRSLDLGGLYESRVFQVLSVADDGEPYPVGEGMKAARMIWYVQDTMQANPTWVRQTAEGPQFEVSQTRFPKAKPGDTVRIRLEVRDSLVDAKYTDWICPQTEDYCCAPDSCSGTNACLRWTTWTVQFQP